MGMKGETSAIVSVREIVGNCIGWWREVDNWVEVDEEAPAARNSAAVKSRVGGSEGGVGGAAMLGAEDLDV